MLVSILAKIAAFKQSTRFTFDYIHALIAYSVITTAVWKFHLNVWLAVGVFSAVILVIEWYFDTVYESATWKANLRDCADYAVGQLLAIAVVKL